MHFIAIVIDYRIDYLQCINYCDAFFLFIFHVPFLLTTRSNYFQSDRMSKLFCHHITIETFFK